MSAGHLLTGLISRTGKNYIYQNLLIYNVSVPKILVDLGSNLSCLLRELAPDSTLFCAVCRSQYKQFLFREGICQVNTHFSVFWEKVNLQLFWVSTHLYKWQSLRIYQDQVPTLFSSLERRQVVLFSIFQDYIYFYTQFHLRI